MRYESIIWDFDGTLFDTYPGMCRNLKEAMHSIGIQASEEELMPRFLISLREAITFCAEKNGMESDCVFQAHVNWVREHPLPEAMPFPHGEDVLKAFWTSGGRNFVFTHRGESVHEYLAQQGWTEYFTEVVPFGPQFERKPSPTGNLYLMETHGLNPDRTLAVGDRELDILAAKAAGIDACLICRGAEAVETAAQHQICDLEELFAVIGLERE
jgi:phosphoglycolate phosphatase-like HAD superfamily hydrolase